MVSDVMLYVIILSHATSDASCVAKSKTLKVTMPVDDAQFAIENSTPVVAVCKIP